MSVPLACVYVLNLQPRYVRMALTSLASLRRVDPDLPVIIKVADDPERPVVVHGVQHVVHAPVTLPAWPDADHRSRLVLIVRDLDPAFVRRIWDAFLGKPAVDTPDRAALTENPLAIPGD